MNFTVLWRPSALGTLAEIWTASANKTAITSASHRLDQRLAVNPLDEGESRNEDERITFEPPLQLLFRVDPATRTVNVTAVGLMGSRR